ncbi:MAG: hypothetical protein E3J81_03535 [Dehalococcoidia bacterium]|nr:MAG: hypothetical protein E3J81_03535 [Dehalococcoidia bacterium]
MKKVYIVTRGEYSDYDIGAVFSDTIQADAYVEAGGGDRVEDYVLDIPYNEWWVTFVCMDREGNVIRTYKALACYEWNKPGFGEFTRDGRLQWRVLTSDVKRAIKVTNEKRSQILAMNLWGQTRKAKEYFESKDDETEIDEAR